VKNSKTVKLRLVVCYPRKVKNDIVKALLPPLISRQRVVVTREFFGDLYPLEEFRECFRTVVRKARENGGEVLWVPENHFWGRGKGYFSWKIIKEFLKKECEVLKIGFETEEDRIGGSHLPQAVGIYLSSSRVFVFPKLPGDFEGVFLHELGNGFYSSICYEFKKLMDRGAQSVEGVILVPMVAADYSYLSLLTKFFYLGEDAPLVPFGMELMSWTDVDGLEPLKENIVKKVREAGLGRAVVVGVNFSGAGVIYAPGKVVMGLNVKKWRDEGFIVDLDIELKTGEGKIGNDEKIEGTAK